MSQLRGQGSSAPPPFPRKPIVATPEDFATSAARRRLRELPDVDSTGIGIWFSGPGAERLLPGLVSERKRTFDQLFRSLQNPRAAVNAVLGFSRWFGRVLGFRVAGPGARKQERAVSEGSLGAQKGWETTSSSSTAGKSL